MPADDRSATTPATACCSTWRASSKRHIREADYVFRWGGDEFLVLITCVGEEAARKAAALKASFDAAPEAVRAAAGRSG